MGIGPVFRLTAGLLSSINRMMTVEVAMERMAGMMNSWFGVFAGVVVVALLGGLSSRAGVMAFESADEIKALTITGEAVIGSGQAHGGAGALAVKRGSRVVWPVRPQDGTGTVEMWIYEDGARSGKPKAYGTGALWGLTQSDGRELLVGPIYAPYLAGDTTYAVGSVRPDKGEKPWHRVQFIGVRRSVGWHKWTFAFDPQAGLRILVDDKDVNARRMQFNWNMSRLDGFTGVVLYGDTSDAGQVLWVDDVNVTLGPVATVKTLWPPPPPVPPADLTVLPQQAPWNPTPFAHWKNGPGGDDSYFPIAVWLQDPKLAPRYKQAGINLYMSLYQGPTKAQMDDLRAAGMPVICEVNDYALAHLDEKLIVGWLQNDEPDNAQAFKTYWKGDKSMIKEGWPELYASQKLETSEYRGYGPAIPPKWVVRDYRTLISKDSTRPVFLGLGQGVAWKGWGGRGERTGHLEDYAEYMKGCDVVGYDIYPAAAGETEVKDALWLVGLGVRRLREWSKDSLPVYAHIETGVIAVPDSSPTPKQVRADVWIALVHGARGIDYFVHQFKPAFNAHALLDNPGMLAEVTAINRQITAWARILNSPTIDHAVTVASTNPKTPVHALVKRKDGATYVFAVGMYQEPTQATFTIAGMSGDGVAEVLDEGRTVPVKNGIFRDAFDGNAVHCYRIVK